MKGTSSQNIRWGCGRMPCVQRHSNVLRRRASRQHLDRRGACFAMSHALHAQHPAELRTKLARSCSRASQQRDARPKHLQLLPDKRSPITQPGKCCAGQVVSSEALAVRQPEIGLSGVVVADGLSTHSAYAHAGAHAAAAARAPVVLGRVAPHLGCRQDRRGNTAMGDWRTTWRAQRAGSTR